MLAKAIAITSKAFEDKTDKAGKPYILHCLRVMSDVGQNDEELMCIAVMHDLIEDCQEWNVYLLLSAGFSERVVKTIEVLTHKKEVSYDDYIKGIALNEDARIVKLADLKDNSNITRLKGLRKKDFDRMEKYHKAFIYLSK
jgi:(p)ppGpp synthase/HD superfamily hydrolase